jgi:tRNA pseudouridine38-40 synthase
MPRYKFIIEYDGTVYAGWQRQRACRTIQGEIEQAIHCLGEANPTVIGAGRTDAGVHARGQVAHVDLKKDWEPLRITGALNHFLKNASIAILKSERIDDTFHARFSAVKREYRYEIICRRSYLALDRYRAWRVPVSLDHLQKL